MVCAAHGKWTALLFTQSDNFTCLLLCCQWSYFLVILINLRATCGQLAGSGQQIILFSHRLQGTSIMQKPKEEFLRVKTHKMLSWASFLICCRYCSGTWASHLRSLWKWEKWEHCFLYFLLFLVVPMNYAFFQGKGRAFLLLTVIFY